MIITPFGSSYYPAPGLRRNGPVAAAEAVPPDARARRDQPGVPAQPALPSPREADRRASSGDETASHPLLTSLPQMGYMPVSLRVDDSGARSGRQMSGDVQGGLADDTAPRVRHALDQYRNNAGLDERYYLNQLMGVDVYA